MKDKLLAALKTKFQGIEDAILDRQAEKLAKTVTTEDQIETAIGGVTFATLLQSETDRRTTEATSTAVKNYEKKHGIKDGKPIEEPPKPPDPPKQGDGQDDPPAWAKALIDSNKQLQEKVSQVEKDRERSTRLSQAKELLKASKISDKLKEKWLDRIRVDDEEKSLEDQVKALEEEYLELKQEHVNASVEGGEPKGGEATDADMEAYLGDKFPKAEAGAEGK